MTYTSLAENASGFTIVFSTLLVMGSSSSINDSLSKFVDGRQPIITKGREGTTHVMMVLLWRQARG